MHPILLLLILLLLRLLLLLLLLLLPLLLILLLLLLPLLRLLQLTVATLRESLLGASVHSSSGSLAVVIPPLLMRPYSCALVSVLQQETATGSLVTPC